MQIAARGGDRGVPERGLHEVDRRAPVEAVARMSMARRIRSGTMGCGPFGSMRARGGPIRPVHGAVTLPSLPARYGGHDMGGCSMRAYNLFRHRDKPHLLCAVPEDGEVPRFIAKRAWRFDRKVTEAAAAPFGFDVLAARHGVQLNGFYPSRISAGAEQQGAAGTISVAEMHAAADVNVPA